MYVGRIFAKKIFESTAKAILKPEKTLKEDLKQDIKSGNNEILNKIIIRGELSGIFLSISDPIISSLLSSRSDTYLPLPSHVRPAMLSPGIRMLRKYCPCES